MFFHYKKNKLLFCPLQVLIIVMIVQPSKKANEYNYQIAIISSNAYKELNKKYQMLK